MAKQDAPSDTNKKDAAAGLADFIGKFSKSLVQHKEKFITMEDIKFPIEVKDIKGYFERPKKGFMSSAEMGALVRIRPCGEEYKDRTFLGIYIGDLPIDIVYEVEKEDGTLHVRTYNNCAFYVFELKKLIFGCESWWAELKDDADIDRMITDADIDNVPYVKVLKAMVATESEEEDDASNEDIGED